VTPDFSTFGAREALAVLMAVIIVADWAVVRYARWPKGNAPDR
jgi:hypothetical protein